MAVVAYDIRASALTSPHTTAVHAVPCCAVLCHVCCVCCALCSPVLRAKHKQLHFAPDSGEKPVEIFHRLKLYADDDPTGQTRKPVVSVGGHTTAVCSHFVEACSCWLYGLLIRFTHKPLTHIYFPHPFAPCPSHFCPMPLTLSNANHSNHLPSGAVRGAGVQPTLPRLLPASGCPPGPPPAAPHLRGLHSEAAKRGRGAAACQRAAPKGGGDVGADTHAAAAAAHSRLADGVWDVE